MKSIELDVVVTRGAVVESRHRVHAAVVDDTDASDWRNGKYCNAYANAEENITGSEGRV
jgi:L-asparaginase II